MTILVVVAVEAESGAVLRDAPRGIDIVVAGVGPVAAATATATALATGAYAGVISAGIAGAFPGRAQVGDLVLATASAAADLGCRSDEGFLTLPDMGLDQVNRLDCAEQPWAERLQAQDLAVVEGEVLTLSCMTGTDADGTSLSERHPRAVAEAMEGWGVAWSAHSVGTPFNEIRGISNLVGRRDPSTWDLRGALDALARAFGVLFAEPLP